MSFNIFFSQGIEPACSCVDCDTACSIIEELKENPENFLIHHRKFILTIFFVSLSLVFTICALREKEEEIEEKSRKISDKTSTLIEDFFTNLGIFCASNPLKVLLIGELSRKFRFRFLKLTKMLKIF